MTETIHVNGARKKRRKYLIIRYIILEYYIIIGHIVYLYLMNVIHLLKEYVI